MEWYNQFKDGRTLVVSDLHFWKPSTSWKNEVVDQVWTLIVWDHLFNIQELAEELGISIVWVHSILSVDLDLWRVSPKFVPKVLTTEQKQFCLDVSQDMLDSANGDQVPEHSYHWWGDVDSWVRPENQDIVITVEIFNIPKAKKKTLQVHDTVKVMLSLTPAGWYIMNTHHITKTLPNGTTWRFLVTFLWVAGTWQLHHDSASAHSSHLTQTFLVKNITPVVHQTPYSPCDF